MSSQGTLNCAPCGFPSIVIRFIALISRSNTALISIIQVYDTTVLKTFESLDNWKDEFIIQAR